MKKVKKAKAEWAAARARYAAAYEAQYKDNAEWLAAREAYDAARVARWEAEKCAKA